MSAFEQNRFDGGIADYPKLGEPNEVAFIRSLDYRQDANALELLPKTSKESGSVITDLVKWGKRVGDTTYLYGDSGKIYSRSLAGSYSLLRTVPNASGNGLEYYGEDGFLYYPTDTALGRYGPFASTPMFVDDFLGSEGGVPTNTHSITLNGTTQYLSAADSATLSITGDLTLDWYIYPTSLPASGSEVAIVAKWDESGATKSYWFGIRGVSGVFGDSAEGALTISTNTTQSPIDASCSGTIGTKTLSATNASFAAGQTILIHQSRGTNAGTFQKTKIAGYTAGTITTEDNLLISYSSTGSNAAQVIVIPEYSSITIDAGVTWSAKAWDGSVGGILVFMCAGTLTVNGTISANGKGYLGGSAASSGQNGRQGEGTAGPRNTASTAANGNGGGGGSYAYDAPADGGGGGHFALGQNGQDNSGTKGQGGTTAGTADLSTMVFGGGGGGGGAWHSGSSGAGGNGGGGVYGFAVNITVNSTTGLISSNGSNGTNPADGTRPGCGGGGGAGSIRLHFQTGTFNTNRITATAGQGGSQSIGNGGDGSVGRAYFYYLTSVSGSSSDPSFGSSQDSNLQTTTTYQLLLKISNDGSAEEEYAKTVAITTDNWYRVGVSWDASASQAEFVLGGVSQGTATGSMTAIDDNASSLYVGAFMGSAAVEGFFAGKLDDGRIYSKTKTAAQFFSDKDVELPGTDPDLEAYYQLDNNGDDSSTNSNTLSATGSPSYSTDVPFSSPTTRLDIDQSNSATGNTYTLPTAINEGNTHRQTFVPAKDPQKSIAVNITAKGTGDWTLTVHDALNREVASVTVANSLLPASGDYEFVFDEPWTPVIGASYHFHLTVTTGTSTVDTGTASSLEDADYTSYYQFLTTGADHPVLEMLNFISVGNGRYLATYNAASGYNPHRLSFPATWKVKALALWNQYLAIGCYKGDDLFDYDEGVIFFWDGISDTYNYYITVPEGGINALHSARGILTVFAGYKGDMLEYTGGTRARKIKRTPNLNRGEYIEIMPGAVTMWDSLLRYGVAGPSDAENVQRGVYTYGGYNENRPNSLSLDYPVSTGNRGSSVEIGMVLPVENKLLVSWKDNVSYGVDVVDPSGSVFATGTVERMIIDQGAVWKKKKALAVKADFSALSSGDVIRLKYKKDRASEWVTKEISTANRTEGLLPIAGNPHREIQIAADVETTNSTSPKLYELTLEEDIEPQDQKV